MIPKTLLTCWGVRFRAGPPRHLLQRQGALAQDQTCHAVDRPVPRAVYIHLPFCKKKCFYCDFPVKAVGMHPSSDGVSRHMEEYVAALRQEIAMTPKQGSAGKRRRSTALTSVYFGGGTPSLVPPPLVGTVLAVLEDKYGIAPGAEITLEADPGTFDAAQLAHYVAIGVTRLSMGVQSFQQDMLDACGRAHSLKEVYLAIEAVKSSGIQSWSLDLIGGLPGLNRDMWRQSLLEAIRAGPDHVSVYDLQVEEGTPFARWSDQGKLSFPPNDEAANMYEDASRLLTDAGYEHYEVSNYAKAGCRSRHNQVYWQGRPYYAFGLGAASFLGGVRFSRPAKMPAYYEWVATSGPLGQAAALDEGVTSSAPSQTDEDALLDTVMLRLRTADGLDMASFSASFGPEAASAVHAALGEHIRRGLVHEMPRLPPVLSDDDDDEGIKALGHNGDRQIRDEEWDFRVRLSDPDGFLLSNSIISDVFAAFSFKSNATQ